MEVKAKEPDEHVVFGRALADSTEDGLVLVERFLPKTLFYGVDHEGREYIVWDNKVIYQEEKKKCLKKLN